jgi:hypothetical protein
VIFSANGRIVTNIDLPCLQRPMPKSLDNIFGESQACIKGRTPSTSRVSIHMHDPTLRRTSYQTKTDLKWTHPDTETVQHVHHARHHNGLRLNTTLSHPRVSMSLLVRILASIILMSLKYPCLWVFKDPSIDFKRYYGYLCKCWKLDGAA